MGDPANGRHGSSARRQLLPDLPFFSDHILLPIWFYAREANAFFLLLGGAMGTIISVFFSAAGCITLSFMWGVDPSGIGVTRFILGWTLAVCLFCVGQRIEEHFNGGA